MFSSAAYYLPKYIYHLKKISIPFFVYSSVDIERLWMADYAGQIPNRGLWLAILVQWL